MNIIVADDDPVYLNLLSEILSLYGHTVFKANDGESAMLRLSSESADMIISDVSMPRMNGVALHSAVREDRRLKRVPFVWNSGYAELRELLDVSDPLIDFKLDKAADLSTLIHIVSRFEAARRIPHAVQTGNA
jgi:CheY-like chemotaxis protein